LQELLEYIVKSLVSKPEEVRIEQSEADGWVNFQLHVAPEEVGKVIGHKGRVAKAIRTLLKIMATREGTRVNLEIGE